jgi:predicted Zn-dependent peptidase
MMLTYGRVLSLEEIVAAVEAVTPADIHRVAGRLLGSGGWAYAAVGPPP